MDHNLSARLVQALFHTCDDSLFLISGNNLQIHEVSAQTERITGKSRDELLKHPVSHWIRAASDPASGIWLESLKAQQSGTVVDGFLIRGPGEQWIPVSLALQDLSPTAPNSPEILLTVRARNQGLADRDVQIQRLERLLQFRRSILERIAQGEPLKEILHQLCLIIEEQTPGALASLLLLDRDGQSLRSAACPSLPVEWVEAMDEVSLAHSPCGEAVLQKQPVVIADLLSDPRCSDLSTLARKHQLCSCICVPILTREQKVLGTLSCYFQEPREATPEDLVDLGQYADLIALAWDRQQAQEALQASQARFQHLLENAHDLILVVDSRQTTQYLSPAAQRFLGTDVGQGMADVGLLSMVHPEDAAQAQKLLETVMRTPGGLERGKWRALRQDGNWRWLDVIAHNLIQDPLLNGVVISAQDVTEWNQDREQAELCALKYRALLENLEQFVFCKDRESRFEIVNRSMCKALGVRLGEIVGKTDFDLYPEELARKYREDDRRVLEEGQSVTREEESIIEGERRLVRVCKTPLRDSHQAIVGVLGIYWDITRERQLEAQHRNASRMEAVGQLAGGITHKFNNLLTSIIGNLSLLLDSEIQSPEVLIREARESAEQGAALTRQLMGFSRQTPVKSRVASMNEVLKEVMGILGPTFDPRIELRLNVENNLWTVLVDVGELQQVLINLCFNARDAMPEGGELLLASQNVTVTDEQAQSHVEARPGEFVRLRVQDKGVGIPSGIQSRIFDPFFTTKGPEKGTGLGLAQVYGIVKQHRGWVTFATEEGEGTTFEIYLPRHEDQQTHPEQSHPEPETVSETVTVLLVDDEPAVCRLGTTILEMEGCEVITAEDGQEAIEIYEQAWKTIDLVILDLSMPRLSGAETFQILRTINPAVRVLISSGYSSDETLTGELNAAVGFLAKPYRPREMLAEVRAALQNRG